MDYSPKKSIWKWILLYVIIAVVAYGVIYYLFFMKNGDSYVASNNQTENSQDVNDKEAPAGETADWKVYKSDEHGFEFKYPSYLQFNTISPKWVTFSSANVAIDIQVDESETDMSGNKITLESYANWLGTNGENVTIEKMSIDGVDARKVSQDVREAAGTTHTTTIVALKNNKAYLFHVVIMGYNSAPYSDEDFYKILSTFKFTK